MGMFDFSGALLICSTSAVKILFIIYACLLVLVLMRSPLYQLLARWNIAATSCALRVSCGPSDLSAASEQSRVGRTSVCCCRLTLRCPVCCCAVPVPCCNTLLPCWSAACRRWSPYWSRSRWERSASAPAGSRCCQTGTPCCTTPARTTSTRFTAPRRPSTHCEYWCVLVCESTVCENSDLV